MYYRQLFVLPNLNMNKMQKNENNFFFILKYGNMTYCEYSTQFSRSLKKFEIFDQVEELHGMTHILRLSNPYFRSYMCFFEICKFEI